MEDVIIVGGGPGGLSAAIYSARYKLKTIVLTKSLGGTAITAYKIHNFPSYEEITGSELMQKMMNQVKKLGVKIIQEIVMEIKKEKNYFSVKTNKKKYHTKKIIFAGGTERKKLNVKGEKKFLGKGVSYCATCDAGFFKDKRVAVIGGNDAALTAALLLAEYARKVFIIYRRDKFYKAEPSWIELVKKEKKIKILFDEEVEEIQGDKKVKKLKITSEKSIDVDGVFIEIGSVPKLDFISSLKIKQIKGYIDVDDFQETNIKGFYAVGDITNNKLKQIIVAAAEGAIAANSAYKKIKQEE